MEEIISLIVANGVFAVLFCGLLVYELKDSRAREKRYNATIRSLSDRLDVVNSVKSDTTEIKADVESILQETQKLCLCRDEIKRVATCTSQRARKRTGSPANANA